MADQQYWEMPSGELLPPVYWQDDEPTIQGLLTAPRITSLCQQTPPMIDPFEEQLLRPAGYNLTLGDLCQVNGKDARLTPEKPTLIIPPNSLVFVAMRQVIRLPHYVAARFNLAIELVYQGVLLGTGPQVDPGFVGVLSCPLYNLSNNRIQIHRGDHIATIDFVKTSGLALASPDPTEADLYGNHGDASHLYGINRRWRRPITAYQGTTNVTGSVTGLARTVKRIRNFGIAGLVLAGVGAVVAPFAIAISLVGPIQTNTQTTGHLDQQVSRLQKCVEQLSSKPSPGALGASAQAPDCSPAP
jgi:deoxycytidine triphosphate deaminase